jgi:hypothetical protein
MFPLKGVGSVQGAHGINFGKAVSVSNMLGLEQRTKSGEVKSSDSIHHTEVAGERVQKMKVYSRLEVLQFVEYASIGATKTAEDAFVAEYIRNMGLLGLNVSPSFVDAKSATAIFSDIRKGMIRGDKDVAAIIIWAINKIEQEEEIRKDGVLRFKSGNGVLKYDNGTISQKMSLAEMKDFFQSGSFEFAKHWVVA